MTYSSIFQDIFVILVPSAPSIAGGPSRLGPLVAAERPGRLQRGPARHGAARVAEAQRERLRLLVPRRSWWDLKLQTW